MKIGTIGTGKMAIRLARLWADAGHEVFLGSRDSQKARDLATETGSSVKGGSQAEAAAFGEVILLAVPFAAAEETLKDIGSLAGKILIDITNPVKMTEQGMGLAMGYTTSAAEEISKWSGAKVVKAFNSVYFEVLERPLYGQTPAGSFFCGDDAQARAVVAQLSQEIGFDPIDCGQLSNARLLEPLAALWMQLAFAGTHGADIAFALLKR